MNYRLKFSSILLFFTLDFFTYANDQLGVENGKEITQTSEVLTKLDEVYSTPVEIILGTAISDTPDFKSEEANPFGHIAIRIYDLVYTVNQNARKLKSKSLFYVQPLRDYLYGTTSPGEGAEIGSHFGLTYSRDNYGIRLDNFTDIEIKKMLQEISIIENEWLSGKFEYSDYWYNCSDITERIFAASEKISSFDLYPITMPIQTFKKVLKSAKDKAKIVTYSRVPDAKNFYSYNRFPISLYSPFELYAYFRKIEVKESALRDLLNKQSSYHLFVKPHELVLNFQD